MILLNFPPPLPFVSLSGVSVSGSLQYAIRVDQSELGPYTGFANGGAKAPHFQIFPNHKGFPLCVFRKLGFRGGMAPRPGQNQGHLWYRIKVACFGIDSLMKRFPFITYARKLRQAQRVVTTHTHTHRHTSNQAYHIGQETEASITSRHSGGFTYNCRGILRAKLL